MGKEEEKKESNLLGPPLLPITSVAHALPLYSTPPPPALPWTVSHSLPSPSGRTYGTHFAGDIEEPPVRPPSAMAPPRPPRFFVAPSVATSFAWRLGHLSDRVPHQPGLPAARSPLWWDRRLALPGASLGRSRAPGSAGGTKPGGGGEEQAGLFLPHLPAPQHGGGAPGPSDQDVAGPGASPARAEGPGTGHQLSRVPRTRPPAAARTLVRDRTGKCAVLSPAPCVRVDAERGSRILSFPTLASEC